MEVVQICQIKGLVEEEKTEPALERSKDVKSEKVKNKDAEEEHPKKQENQEQVVLEQPREEMSTVLNAKERSRKNKVQKVLGSTTRRSLWLAKKRYLDLGMVTRLQWIQVRVQREIQGIRRTREQLGKENKGIGRDKIVSEENNKRTKILGSSTHFFQLNVSTV